MRGQTKTPMSPRFFYGWVMVGLSFVLQGVGFGSQYLAGVLFEPLQRRLAVSAAVVSLITMSIATAVTAVLSPGCGALLQRYPLRWFIVAGFAAVGLGYVGLAFAVTWWQVTLLYATGFAVGVLVSLLAGATLVSNWFVGHRGLALGIATAGSSFAGGLIPPIAANGIESFGLPTTSLAFGVTILLLAPLAWWLTVDRPEAVGELPDGRSVPAAAPPTQGPESAWTLRRLLLSTRFWNIAALIALTNIVSTVLVVNLIQLAGPMEGRIAASYLMTYAFAAAVVGSVVFGRWFDGRGQRTIALFTVGVTALPCLLLLLLPPSHMLLVVVSVVVGLGIGASLLIFSLLTAVNFRRSFALALGAINPIMLAGFALALPLFGWSFDLDGNYDRALIGFIVALALTAIAAWRLPSRPDATPLDAEVVDEELFREPG